MNERDKKALVWGGAVIVGAVLCLGVIPWATREVSASWEAATSRRATLARAQTLLAERYVVRDSLGRVLSQIIALAPQLVEGKSPAEAQASLASLLSLAASRHALRILRADALPDSALGVFSRVALHAELEGDIAGLTRLLRAVETATPLLSVTALGVSVQDPASPSNQAELLRIDLDVAGYYLPRRAQ
jgi:hypothetical protein